MFYNGNIQVLEDLSTLATKLNVVEIVTPVNEKTAKAKWLEDAARGDIVNPSFCYDRELLASVAESRDRFERLVEDFEKHLITGEDASPYAVDNFLSAVKDERISEARYIIRLAAAILNQDMEEADLCGRQLYGVPGRKTVEAAEYAALVFEKPTTAEAENTIDAEGIAAEFKNTLLKLGITGWNCIISPTATAIDVRDNTSGIYIPNDRQVSSSKLKKLVGHEINCHLLGSENSRDFIRNFLDTNNPLRILAPWWAKSTDETIYEGVAKASDTHLESMLVASKGNAELPVPWYTLAIDYALQGNNFSQTAEFIISQLTKVGYSEKQAQTKAWIYCRRIFRGSTNTATAGFVFTKDYAYFNGYNLYHEEISDVRAVFRNYSSLGLKILKKYTPLLSQYLPTHQPLTDSELL